MCIVLACNRYRGSLCLCCIFLSYSFTRCFTIVIYSFFYTLFVIIFLFFRLVRSSNFVNPVIPIPRLCILHFVSSTLILYTLIP